MEANREEDTKAEENDVMASVDLKNSFDPEGEGYDLQGYESKTSRSIIDFSERR